MAHLGPHNKVMGEVVRWGKRENGPGVLLLLELRVRTWGFLVSLYIGEFKT